MYQLNKKWIVLVAVILTAVFCFGCAKPIEESIEIIYGDTYRITNEKIDKLTDLQWASSDDTVATVSNRVVTGHAPGEAIVTAKQSEKLLAQYKVTVKVIPVTSIVLSTNACEITEGESYDLSYTLFPTNASDYGLDWKSADTKVATVNDSGSITGVAPGQTTISISNTDGFIATCSVTVKKALPNFKAMYSKWENEKWFSLADDGTWMRFDGNPSDADSDNYWEYYDSFSAVNDNLPSVLQELGYSSSVYEKMNQTTWSMGRQIASTDTTTATWTYHPDKGLEVLIEVNK